MPFNGVGTFTSLGVPTFPAVTGEYILASYFNATINDIFSGLSLTLPKDGQAAMAANLSMANFKITGLGNGVAATDAVNFAQVFVSPTFTGIPRADTAVLGTNTTQLATTEFVTSTAFAGVTQNPTPGFVLHSLGVY